MFLVDVSSTGRAAVPCAAAGQVQGLLAAGRPAAAVFPARTRPGASRCVLQLGFTKQKAGQANSRPVSLLCSAGKGASEAPQTGSDLSRLSKADVEAMKVTELQAVLQQLGLPKSGRKAELQERVGDALGVLRLARAAGMGSSAPPAPTKSAAAASSAAAPAAAAAAAPAPKARSTATAAAAAAARLKRAAPTEQQQHDDNDKDEVEEEPITAAPLGRRLPAARGSLPAQAPADAPGGAMASRAPGPRLTGRRNAGAAVSAAASADQQVHARIASGRLASSSSTAGADARTAVSRGALRSGAAAAALPASARAAALQEIQQRQQREEEEEEEEEEEGYGEEEEERAPSGAREPGWKSQRRRYQPQDEEEVDMADAPDLDHLPPLEEGLRGRLLTLKELDLGMHDERLTANSWDFTISCIGTAARHTTPARSTGGLALVRGKDTLVFDAGDDTQRRIYALPTVKGNKIYRVFLTSLLPECTLGLPGLLCVISSSRLKGHEEADVPIHIYGPPGTAEFISVSMRISHTYLETSILVHEVAFTSSVKAEPELYNKRARIWRVAMPPDQLNPHGRISATLNWFKPTQGRSRMERGRNSGGGVMAFDRRAGWMPFSDPTPGDPSREGRVAREDMTWTLELDVSSHMVISAMPAPHDALAYVFQEADRTGALAPERAEALGLNPHHDYAAVKDGRTVVNKWGQTVTPDLVVTPVRPGRRMVLLPSCTDPSSVTRLPLARNADVLVANSVFPTVMEAEASKAGACTAAAVGAVAQALGVRALLLYRFDGRFAGQAPPGTVAAGQSPPGTVAAAKGAKGDPFARAVWQEACEHYTHGRTYCAEDGDTYVHEKHEGAKEPPPQ